MPVQADFGPLDLTVRRPILVRFGDAYSVPPIATDPQVALQPTVQVQNPVVVVTGPPAVAGPSGVARAPLLAPAFAILDTMSSDVTSDSLSVVRYHVTHLERDLQFLSLRTDEELAQGMFVFYCFPCVSF